MSPAEQAGDLVAASLRLLRELASDASSDPRAIRAARDCWEAAKRLHRLVGVTKA